MTGGELTEVRTTRGFGERWVVYAALVAAAVSLAIVGVVVVSFMLWIGRNMAPMPVPFGRTPAGVLGLVISPISYAAVGGIMAAKLPRNPIGWLFLAAGVALGMMLPVNLLVASAHESFRPASDLVVAAGWLRTSFATPTVLTSLVLAAYLFPNGTPLPGKWQRATPAIVLGGALLILGVATDPRGLLTYPTLPNPMALPASLELLSAAARLGGLAVLLGGIAAALASMWVRYRQGNQLQRAQLRWIVLAAGLTAATSLPFLVASYVLRVDDATGEALAAVSQVGLCTFPVASAFAISRYRLFDIDAVIGRTLVYVPLMALLGGMYTSGVALFQRLFVAVTGQESDTAVVAAILVVASAFTPLRKGLEGLVDRRFAARREPAETAPPPAPGARSAPTHASVLPVDERGAVPCPLRPNRTIRDCIQCARLLAVVDDPELSVVCRTGADA